MKTIKLPLIMVLLLLTISFFPACKKSSNDKDNCRIITTSGTVDTYNYTYNSEGKLATITQGTKLSTFSYSANTIVVNGTNSGNFSFKRIVTVNSNGLASNMKIEKNISGTDWENTLFEYNGTQVIKTTVTKSTGGAPVIETFDWANGNMVTHNYSGNTTTYEYHSGKPSQDGDFFHHLQLANYGYFFIQTKNTLKSFTTPAYIATIEYSYDNENKISSMQVTYGYSTPQIVTFNYQYQCN